MFVPFDPWSAPIKVASCEMEYNQILGGKYTTLTGGGNFHNPYLAFTAAVAGSNQININLV